MLHRLNSLFPKLKHRGSHQKPSIYEPLPAGGFVRVLELHPGRRGDQIDCSLRTVTLKNYEGQYEALSYVWGDHGDTVEVKCNGTRIAITLNLADALRNFREQHGSRLLWVDAICINQKDDLERGHQVTLMGEVFSRAKRVLVWLGCDSETIAAATFALIRDTNRYLDEVYVQSGYRYSLMPQLESPYPISVDLDQWSGVVTLLSFPWFTRVWTVQEAALARDCRMFWGSNSINAADVFEICVWYARKPDLLALMGKHRSRIGFLHRVPYSIMISIHSRYQDRSVSTWQESRATLKGECSDRKGKDIIAVLSAARPLQASDPRDHVYAFLGCPSATDEAGQAIVEADYTISMEEVCMQVACKLLQNPTQSYQVLLAVNHYDRNWIMDSHRPSWVPRWHVPYHGANRVSLGGRYFKSGGSSQQFSAQVLGDKALAVCGFNFDEIAWISGALDKDKFFLVPRDRDQNTTNSGKPFIDSFWIEVSQVAVQLGISISEDDLILTLARSSSCEPHVRYTAYRKIARLAHANAESVGVITAQEKSDAIVVQSRLLKIGGRRLIITKDGRLGLTGVVAEVGDICSIFLGAPVPFLVTPASDGRHRLIGECYIFGVMAGELLDSLIPDVVANGQIILG